jgi:hypothetical protein
MIIPNSTPVEDEEIDDVEDEEIDDVEEIDLEGQAIYSEDEAIDFIVVETGYDHLMVNAIMQILWDLQDDGVEDAYEAPDEALARHLPDAPRNILGAIANAELAYLGVIGAVEN